MEHSIREYLNRRSIDELKGLLRYCIRDSYQNDKYIIPDLLDVLAEREQKEHTYELSHDLFLLLLDMLYIIINEKAK